MRRHRRHSRGHGPAAARSQLAVRAQVQQRWPGASVLCAPPPQQPSQPGGRRTPAVVRKVDGAIAAPDGPDARRPRGRWFVVRRR